MTSTVTAPCPLCDGSFVFEVDGYKPLGGYCEDCETEFYDLLPLTERDALYDRACVAVHESLADQAEDLYDRMRDG